LEIKKKMLIKNNELRPGDIILFKRGKQDKLGLILSLILKLFYPKWDMWGWHMAVVVWKNGDSWYFIEATWPKVGVKKLTDIGEYRVYRWFQKEPCYTEISRFVQDHIDAKYDVLAYVWAALYGILNKRFHINIGKYSNESYYCWELVEEYCECMGKPLTTKNITLLLPDIQKELEEE
jgi:hypothetical protein